MTIRSLRYYVTHRAVCRKCQVEGEYRKCQVEGEYIQLCRIILSFAQTNNSNSRQQPVRICRCRESYCLHSTEINYPLIKESRLVRT